VKAAHRIVWVAAESRLGDHQPGRKARRLSSLLKVPMRIAWSPDEHEDGVSGRIDLGARLGPALTACTGVTARGVRASHGMHGVPGRRRRQVLTFERCDTHDRTVFRGAQSL
jgi:hypothetical protein